MSVMIGCIFIDLGFDQIAVRDRVGLFFIMGGLYPFIVILDTIAKFTAGTHMLLIASAPSTTCLYHALFIIDITSHYNVCT